MKSIDVDIEFLRRWKLPDPNDGESKEDRGRVLIVGGSREVPGAALLAAHASLRAGAGKLHIAAPADVAPAIAIAMPEARVSGLAATTRGEIAVVSDAILAAAGESDALLIGPGMAPSKTTQRVGGALTARARHVVLDAGALGADPAESTVITPHFGEMATLLGCSKDEVANDAEDIARRYAREHGLVVVLKSATTYIAAPAGDLWVHRGGSIGLGTSGSGDVLAGIIAGLMAQGAAAEQAAVWGVVLHGAAGTTLSKRVGIVGFLAREIADAIPRIRSGLDD